MNSSNKRMNPKYFRLKTHILEMESLAECFRQLDLTTSDIILTNSFLIRQFEESRLHKEATLLNLDDYGYGEPKEEWVDEVLAKTNSKSYKRVVAIGGGSTIDIAKLCVFGDGRSAKKLFEEKDQLKKKRELIVLPTTCGTGSEVTSVAVVEFKDLNSKLGLQIDALFPDKAILIGDLLSSLPYNTFALTSIDALAHAVESLLSPKANPYTDMFAKTAIEGILENFKEIRGKQCLPKDMQKSLVCANMAGIAFSIAGCATMHALSFPLGANYHLAHGEAVYAVFGSVLDDYVQSGSPLDKLQTILKGVLHSNCDPVSDLLSLLSDIYECPDFHKLQITLQDCDSMGVSVFEHQQRLLVNSPKKHSSNDLANIYKNCLNGGRI